MQQSFARQIGSRRIAKIILSIALVALPAAGGVYPKPQTAALSWLDLEYARVNNVSLRLDLYLPETAATPSPMIVWVHGGGWTSGSNNLDANDPQLRQVMRGYAVASINYRLSTEAQFPA